MSVKTDARVPSRTNRASGERIFRSADAERSDRCADTGRRREQHDEEGCSRPADSDSPQRTDDASVAK